MSPIRRAASRAVTVGLAALTTLAAGWACERDPDTTPPQHTQEPTDDARSGLGKQLLGKQLRGKPRLGKPRVVVSVAPQAYVAERLAGDRIEAYVLIPAGAAESTYEPGVQQLRAIEEAGLYIKVGHPAFAFERSWLDTLLQANASLRIVDAQAAIVQGSWPGGVADPHGDDPHNWVSPESLRRLVPPVCDALAELLPDAAARTSITTQRAALLRDIDDVDQAWRAMLARTPGRAFFVVHEAWGYLAAEYGLEQIAIEHGANKPGPAELQRLINEARRRGARVIMAQQQFDPATARLVAEEIGAEVVVVDPLARDWVANMRALIPIFERALVR